MKLSASVRGGRKTHNKPQAARAKTEVRRRVLEAIGADQARVFDAFAGSGTMHRQVWHQAAEYVGCDLDWYRDERLAYVADNRRVLRAIDLWPFNVFDFDAFGSPWEQCLILADRRSPLQPGERLGLALTEGSGLKLKMGSFPTALRILAGIRREAAGGSRSTDELLDRCLAGLCDRMRATVAQRWQAGQSQGASAMRYVGLILVGRAV